MTDLARAGVTDLILRGVAELARGGMAEVTERRGGIGGLREWSGGGGVWFAEVLFACFALGGFGAAALGAAGLGGGLVGLFGVLELFGVFSGILRCGRFGGGFAIWSGGFGVFRFCQVLFSLVQNLGGLVQVVRGRGGGLGGGFASGEGGGFEFVGGEAVFAQQGDHGAAVLAVEPDDVGRGDLSDERGGAVVLQLGVLEQGFEGVGVGELAELLGGVFESFEDVVVGDGLDDLWEGFVEEAEVGVGRWRGRRRVARRFG